MKLGALVLGASALTATAWDLDAAVKFAEDCCGPDGCTECPCHTLGKGAAAMNNKTVPDFMLKLEDDAHPDECACECAEFVSHILKHGGEDDGNIINCIPLYAWLDGAHGWHKIGESATDVHKGDIIIYAAEGPKTHTCFGVGDGIVACHNNNHCDAAANMG
jgi:hypothetical protein